jgi:hypothetical protein
MLIYFLIICTSVDGGVQCLPAQRMPSQKACWVMGDRYVATGNKKYGGSPSYPMVSYDCPGIKL